MKLIFLLLSFVNAQNLPADTVCAKAAVDYVKKWKSKAFDMTTFKLEETRSPERQPVGNMMKLPTPEVPLEKQIEVIFSHLVKGNVERCYGAVITLEFKKERESCVIKRVLDTWPGDCRQEP